MSWRNWPGSFKKGRIVGIDLQQILAIGGPTGIASFLIALLVKSYFDAKKDKREQQAANVSTDSGIVDNAKKVLDLVRSETDRMKLTIDGLAEENKVLTERLRKQDLHINEQDDRIARQDRELEFLREDLSKAQSQITELRNRGTST